MSLMLDLLKESASGGSTGGGSIAGTQPSLFGKDNGGVTIMRRIGYVPVEDLPSKKKKKPFAALKEAVANTSDVRPYDYQETIAKLDQAVQTASEDRGDVAVFGLEDDMGKIVKVYINKDQADSFESALAAMLADGDEMFIDDVEPKTGEEIAEILFKLKDEFDIVDVEWGTIEGDEEEEETDLEGDAEGMDGEMEDAEGELGDDELGDELGDDELGDTMDGDATEEEAVSALQAVINMMQAEAQAKLADAEARKAEAEAAIAANAAAAAGAKVKQEEEILAMQDHEKAQKEAKKEAETLAKLAKYKQETSDGDDAEIGIPMDSVDKISVEQEEVTTPGPRNSLSKEQLANLILKYARTNQR